MPKRLHEVRDPIHIFVHLDSGERKVLDSPAFQRLRHIHQLAFTFLVYPGATHRRFEHSLGVMELAGRVYDIVTEPDNLFDDSVRDIVPKYGEHDHKYWRRVLRVAALCHDIGHIPFSHAAEGLLPAGWDHERLTLELIDGKQLKDIWNNLKIQADDVAKLAVGPTKYAKKYGGASFSTWEAILSEIIIGDAFGVDRIDYLLRDSHHAGVAYGKFDHYRLIDTIRILRKAEGDSTEPTLGVEEGGLYSAEALLWARYFMYTQLYFHPIRRIYDIHLKDFLHKWLPEGHFPVDISEHLKLTDNEVMSEILKASRDTGHPSHDPARRITNREHFRLIYTPTSDDAKRNPEPGNAVFNATVKQFGESEVRYDAPKQKSSGIDFPVLAGDGRVESSLSRSNTLNNVPAVSKDYVFISPEHREQAVKWLQKNLQSIIDQS